jgi:carbon starvation protein CstA
MYAAPTSTDSWGKDESVMAWFGASLTCLLLMFTLKILLAITTLLPEPVSGICAKHGVFGQCNELYFSGHVASVMICAWFVCQRWHDRPRWVTLISCMYVMTVVILALLSRIHYSIDVFGAICLVGALFYMLSLDSPPPPNDTDDEAL